MSAALTLAGRAHPYRPLSHLAGRRLRRAGRHDDHAARPQRRRKDDYLAHDHGPVAGLEGTDRAWADALAEPGRERRRAAWRRLCAGDDGGVLRSFGQGEPRPRRARSPAGRRPSRLDLRLLSGAEEILAVARRRAVGRAEADAVDRARDRRAARTAADRRADQGPCRRRSSARSSPASTRSRRPASRSCWSSRTFASRARSATRFGSWTMAASSIAARWRSSPPTKRCKTACSA